MIATTKLLRLSFTTTMGKNITLTVANPREDLTTAEVERVMDIVLQKNIFITSNGELSSKRDARIVGISTEDLYNPPLS